MWFLGIINQDGEVFVVMEDKVKIKQIGYDNFQVQGGFYWVSGGVLMGSLELYLDSSEDLVFFRYCYLMDEGVDLDVFIGFYEIKIRCLVFLGKQEGFGKFLDIREMVFVI